MTTSGIRPAWLFSYFYYKAMQNYSWIVLALEVMSYKKRRRLFDLLTVDERQASGEMMTTFKFTNGLFEMRKQFILRQQKRK